MPTPPAPSPFSSPITWIAIAAGVGAGAVAMNEASKSKRPAKAHVVGPQNGEPASRGSASKRSKKSKKSKKAVGSKASGSSAKSAKPPSAYTRFVQAQMPALLAKGYSSPEAMKVIGKLWQARK